MKCNRKYVGHVHDQSGRGKSVSCIWGMDAPGSWGREMVQSGHIQGSNPHDQATHAAPSVSPTMESNNWPTYRLDGAHHRGCYRVVAHPKFWLGGPQCIWPQQ